MVNHKIDNSYAVAVYLEDLNSLATASFELFWTTSMAFSLKTVITLALWRVIYFQIKAWAYKQDQVFIF